MKLQKLYSKVRQALDDYNMITENDKIAIGVSGGKDSLTLLYALSGIRSFYPVPFKLVAIAIDLGYDDFDLAPVKALCDELSVEFYVVKTDIGRISLEKSKNQASPCSWCAKLRKGALNDFALSAGVQESMPLRWPHAARICKTACQTAQSGKSGCQEEAFFCYSKRQH